MWPLKFLSILRRGWEMVSKQVQSVSSASSDVSLTRIDYNATDE